MNHLHLISFALLACSCLFAAGKAEKPLVTAELDSIECNFAAAQGKPPFTMRIHLSPQKGVVISPHQISVTPHEPLQCVDAKGNLLLGTFREWEYCYDGNDACYTAVYDFFTVPQGNSVSVDAHIPVPISRTRDQAHVVTFSPSVQQQLEVAGHSIRIEPIEPTTEAKRAGHVAFTIIYDHPATRKLLQLRHADGSMLQGRARMKESLKHGINTDDGTRVTYFIQSDQKTSKLAMVAPPDTSTAQVPLRFRVSIGSLEEKPTSPTPVSNANNPR